MIAADSKHAQLTPRTEGRAGRNDLSRLVAPVLVAAALANGCSNERFSSGEPVTRDALVRGLGTEKADLVFDQHVSTNSIFLDLQKSRTTRTLPWTGDEQQSPLTASNQKLEELLWTKGPGFCVARNTNLNNLVIMSGPNAEGECFIHSPVTLLPGGSSSVRFDCLTYTEVGVSAVIGDRRRILSLSPDEYSRSFLIKIDGESGKVDFSRLDNAGNIIWRSNKLLSADLQGAPLDFVVRGPSSVVIFSNWTNSPAPGPSQISSRTPPLSPAVAGR